MKNLLLPALILLATASSAIPVQDVAAPSSASTPRAASGLPRLIVYYQTTHDAATGKPISMLPLVTEKRIALTHIIVCSFHVRQNDEIYLNDFPPGHARFQTLWNETRVLQAAGVQAMGMVGGAAAGSFSAQTLDGDGATFERYYGQLRDLVRRFGLQGMDLDVEQRMSQAGITRLVRRLRADFGPGFAITLAPVATALLAGGGNLSGFDYADLEAAAGADVAFYNAQFYNGFGSMRDTRAFDAVVASGWAPPRVVVGQVTTPDNGADFVEFPVLNATLAALRSKHGEIGGVMGWEYFNSRPGGTAEPWKWAQEMTAILRPGAVPRLTVTREEALTLIQAWKGSAAAAGNQSASSVPDVDYMALVETEQRG